jgi:phospholipase C
VPAYHRDRGPQANHQPPQLSPKDGTVTCANPAASAIRRRLGHERANPYRRPNRHKCANDHEIAIRRRRGSDKIKSVIFFIQENHTFDSLFAGFPGADSVNAGQVCADRLPADPPHQHADSFRIGAYTTAAAHCSYTEQSAATYWRLASQFTLCDRFFSDVRGPSHPNYFMMTSAQTPIVNTPFPTDECPDFCYDIPTLANRLSHHLSWRDYGGIMTVSRAWWAIAMDRQDAQYFTSAAASTFAKHGLLNSDFLENGDELSGHNRQPVQRNNTRSKLSMPPSRARNGTPGYVSGDG